MRQVRPRASWTSAALLGLVLAGCTTDVVEFPLKSSSDAAAAVDAVAWSCTITETEIRRCTTCKAPWSEGAITTICEDLYCQVTLVSDGGNGKSGCKTCVWSEHPKEKCKICWDTVDKIYFDSCHAKKDAGP